MGSIVSQVTKAQIANYISNGLPKNAELLYFNPKVRVGSTKHIRAYPIDVTSIASVMDEESVFILLEAQDTDDDESSFDGSEEDQNG